MCRPHPWLPIVLRLEFGNFRPVLDVGTALEFGVVLMALSFALLATTVVPGISFTGSWVQLILGGAIFGNAPCFGSQWGFNYLRKITNFLAQTGLDLLEHDGPYPGDICASTNHPGHRGEADSQWVNWSMSAGLYRWCRDAVGETHDWPGPQAGISRGAAQRPFHLLDTRQARHGRQTTRGRQHPEHRAKRRAVFGNDFHVQRLQDPPLRSALLLPVLVLLALAVRLEVPIRSGDGAAIVARSDGKWVGILLVEEGRTNLLLNSATLGTQGVTVTAVAHTLSFYGTGTITLNGGGHGTDDLDRGVRQGGPAHRTHRRCRFRCCPPGMHRRWASGYHPETYSRADR